MMKKKKKQVLLLRTSVSVKGRSLAKFLSTEWLTMYV